MKDAYISPSKEGFYFGINAAGSLSIASVRLCEELGFIFLDNQNQLTRMIWAVLSKKPSSHRKEMLDYIIHKLIGKERFLEKYSAGVFLDEWLIKYGKDALKVLIEDYDVSINTHYSQSGENILMMYLLYLRNIDRYENYEKCMISIQYILKKEIDLNWMDEEGNNYIKYLLIKQKLGFKRKELWKMFIPYMKREHFHQKNKLGQYPICHAFTLYPFSIRELCSFLNFLINKNDSLDLGIDFSVTDSKGRNIFYTLSQYKKYGTQSTDDMKFILKIVDRLLEKGADPYLAYPTPFLSSNHQHSSISTFEDLPRYIQKHIEETWDAYQVKEPS